MSLVNWIRLLLLALVWGSAFFLIEIGLRGSGPLTVVLVRVALAALVLHVYCRLRSDRIAWTQHLLRSFAVMGVIAIAIPFSLIALGQTQITSSLTAILIATTPLFTVVIAHLWRRAEPATPAKLTGVVTGFMGVAVLMGPHALAEISGTLLGQAAMLGAAVSYAVSAVFGRRFRNIPPSATSAALLTVATLYIAPLAFLFEMPLSPLPGAGPFAAMIALALFSTAIAYILYFSILASAGATNAMLVTLVQPPIAIVLGAAFLGETLEPNQFAGLGLIIAGLVLVDGRVHRAILARAHRRTS